jgi:hypothetical protein
MGDLTENDMASARRKLAGIGLTGPDVYLAELVPAVEMAWADGTVHPHERALLEAYCDHLVEHLNALAGAPVFSGRRARAVLGRLLERRLKPHERQDALLALKLRAGRTSHGVQMLRRTIEWSEAVAAVAGNPVWDSRELFWLQTMLRTFEVEQ